MKKGCIFVLSIIFLNLFSKRNNLNNRYSSTERLGVIATDLIITRDLNWIFREQPILDVGLDAFIEKVENNNPTGQFLAVQIKTGLGNFHKQDKYLTYYISQIHYNYWVNLSIPIILVAHIPEENSTYWVQIDRRNIKKTKKKWKIDIPLNQFLNKNSKQRLDKIFSSTLNSANINFSKKYIDFSNISNEVDDSLVYIYAAADSISNMHEYMLNLSLHTREATDKINQSNVKQDHKLFNDAIRLFSLKMNLESRKLEKEIMIFAKNYAKGTLKMNHILFRLFSQEPGLAETVDVFQLYSLLEDTKNLLSALQELKESASTLSFKQPVFKEAKKQHLEIIELIMFEFSEANLITNELIRTIEDC